MIVFIDNYELNSELLEQVMGYANDEPGTIERAELTAVPNKKLVLDSEPGNYVFLQFLDYLSNSTTTGKQYGIYKTQMLIIKKFFADKLSPLENNEALQFFLRERSPMVKLITERD